MDRVKPKQTHKIAEDAALGQYSGFPAQAPSEEDEASPADQEEQPVVQRHMCGQIADVVQVEQMVIYDSLDQVEPSPAKNQKPGKPPRRRYRNTSPGIEKKQVHADERGYPYRGVEKPVPHHVLLNCFERDRWDDCGTHVVPVDYLMQHNAINEAAEAYSENDAGPFRTVLCEGLHVSADEEARHIKGREDGAAVSRVTGTGLGGNRLSRSTTISSPPVGHRHPLAFGRPYCRPVAGTHRGLATPPQIEEADHVCHHGQ